MTGRYRIIWPHSLTRGSVAAAVHDAMAHGHVGAIRGPSPRSNFTLQRSPQTAGESRGEYRRVLVEPPVAVEFEVHDDEMVVLIVQFRYSPRPQAGNGG